jgi:hypothetical protein
MDKRKNKNPVKGEDTPITIKDIVDFGLGRRVPITEKEKALANELKQIEKDGYIVDVPSELP